MKKDGMEVGRPTELTDKLTLEIRRLVLDGWQYVKIQAELGVSAGTWDTWVHVNWQGFRDDLRSWKQEKMVKKAEDVLDELTDSEDEKIKLDSSKFILETLSKDNYSKRNEHTGADGSKLFKWQDDENDNNTVQAEEVGEDIPPIHEALDSVSTAPESGEDDSDTESPTT